MVPPGCLPCTRRRIRGRGKQTGEWYHWLQSSQRTPSTPLVLNLVNTLEARIRVPGVPETQYAEMAMTTQDGGWSLRLTTNTLDFNGLNFNFNATAWLTYRITTEWNVDHYDKKLYVIGIHVGTSTAAPFFARPTEIAFPVPVPPRSQSQFFLPDYLS